MLHPPADIGDADFDTIEAAVMESARGRWFLAEYARRNRHADTQLLLAALARLEAAIGPRDEPAPRLPAPRLPAPPLLVTLADPRVAAFDAVMALREDERLPMFS